MFFSASPNGATDTSPDAPLGLEVVGAVTRPFRTGLTPDAPLELRNAAELTKLNDDLTDP
jgi:hypothetical protein